MKIIIIFTYGDEKYMYNGGFPGKAQELKEGLSKENKIKFVVFCFGLALCERQSLLCKPHRRPPQKLTKEIKTKHDTKHYNFGFLSKTLTMCPIYNGIIAVLFVYAGNRCAMQIRQVPALDYLWGRCLCRECTF